MSPPPTPPRPALSLTRAARRARPEAIVPWAVIALATALGLASCGTPPCGDDLCAEETGSGDASIGTDGGPRHDAGSSDSGSSDAGSADSGSSDAGSADSGSDSGSSDSGSSDSGSSDSGPSDSGSSDSGPSDSGSSDAGSGGPGGCVSGAVGTHVARFKWIGSGPSSTANVSYELNNLPDTSRWHIGAYSRSGVGYVPRFTDTFLGVGGLEMGGTVFIDVELSTAMLSSLRHVTLAVFGRSFNTTSPGSFSWMTFDGAGDAPSGLVSNSAPYRWYSVDATSAFRAGNAGVLLRISPGGPSGTLIVSRVELCFDATR